MNFWKTLTIALAFSVSLSAQVPAPGQPPEGQRQPDALVEFLQLSPEQVQQLTDIRAALREAVQSDFEQIRTLQQQLREELRSDNPNPAVVGQLEVDIENLKASIAETRSEFSQQARSVLTAEQSVALAALEQALAMIPAARQALAFNLIENEEGGAFIGGAGRSRRGRSLGGRGRR